MCNLTYIYYHSFYSITIFSLIKSDTDAPPINRNSQLQFGIFSVTMANSKKEEDCVLSKFAIVLLILLAILIVGLVILYFLGKKAQAKRDEQQAQMDAVAQQVSMLIIDKKRMKLKDAGLPQFIVEQTPKYMRRAKLPVVKAKIGPKVMSLIADESIFDEIPVKKEVKATISGIYITSVKGLRGPLQKPKAKKGFRAKLQDSYKKANEQLKAEKASADTKNKKKKK